MTPAQRKAIFDENTSTDINDIPPDMLARARERIEAHAAQQGLLVELPLIVLIDVNLDMQAGWQQVCLAWIQRLSRQDTLSDPPSQTVEMTRWLAIRS